MMFLNKVKLHQGDCLEVLPTLAENSIDACVTDPPYGLEFMGVAWDTYSTPKGGARADADFQDYGSKEHPRNATSQARIMRNKNVAFGEFSAKWAREVYRVLKPGAHLLAFGGTRTFHRMACAIEDAGFEIRDTIMWLYGSGFPKSHDISKAIDRAAGAERTEIIGVKPGHEGFNNGSLSSVQSLKGTMGGEGGFARPWMDNPEAVEKYHHRFAPVTDAARQWEGWGTALKPACEPIILARKPLSEKTVAANVLKWGTGAINIDKCRVAAPDGVPKFTHRGEDAANCYGDGKNGSNRTGEMDTSTGRWPANVLHDGSEEVVGAFPETKSGQLLTHHKRSGGGLAGSDTFAIRERTGEECNFGGDSGSAARFFYCAKADSDNRIASKHPTVKPVDLMRWLVRLITPKGGIVLDPFAGTGTTGEVAYLEDNQAILIEREGEYCQDIKRRMALVLSGPEEKAREMIKASGKLQDYKDLPLLRLI